MTATEFRLLLDRLGLTQVGAARLLGVDDRTVRRWIAGDREIPPPVEACLLTWEKLGIPKEIRKRLIT